MYVYNPVAGTLDLYAQGDRRWRDSLRELFCTHFLGQASLLQIVDEGCHGRVINAGSSRQSLRQCVAMIVPAAEIDSHETDPGLDQTPRQ